MHQTLEKFAYPQTLLKSFEHWHVLRRPAQVTLGALVLVSTHDITSLAALPPEACAELHVCFSEIDAALRKFRPFDRLNYLALMMVDPQVHFHVLPRYASAQTFDNVICVDTSWPGPPDLKVALALPEATHQQLHQALLHCFANAP